MNLPTPRPKIRIDGIAVNIKWEKFQIGTSFFVPCIDDQRFIAKVRRVTDELGYKVRAVPRVENGKWGVRVWRIL